MISLTLCSLCVSPFCAYSSWLAFPTAISLAVACAMLSVLVVSRRWAFIGEGISHSGFGGAGTAWLLALFIPAMDQSWAPYACAIVFCLVTAIGIGFLSYRERVNSDSAIGIFMVASLAWGFLARPIYAHIRHRDPFGFDSFLFGEMGAISLRFMVAAVVLSAVVIVVIGALWKEILYYCFDPLMAEASGVAAGFVHYLLMILVATMIVLGMPVIGSVLITALLILPGATALLISHRLRTVIIAAVTIAVIGALLGVLLNLRWRFIPAGPAIVLVMFVEFLLCYFGSLMRIRNGQMKLAAAASGS